MRAFIIFSISLLLQASNAIVGHVLSTTPVPQASVEPLQILPNGTAAENLAVREDGSVLVTILYPSAALYYYPASNYNNPVLLYNFTDSASAYGITKYTPDKYVVLTGTFSRFGNVTNATGVAWTVDLTDFRLSENGTIVSTAAVSRLANLTNIGFLNGAETLNIDTVLAADSVKGVVYAIDTQKGNYSVVLNDTALAPNTTGLVQLGVNGLRIINNTLYFTNTNYRSVAKVLLNADGTAAGPYTIVTTNVLVDDLEVDPLTGAVYLPSLVANEITYVSPNGTAFVLAGSLNSTDVPGPTSIRFARLRGQGAERYSRLLISTSGGIEYPINGTYYMGGGLYQLNVTASPIERRTRG